MEIDFVANATDHKTAALLLLLTAATTTAAATKYGITITAAVALAVAANQIK